VDQVDVREAISEVIEVLQDKVTMKSLVVNQ